MTKPVRLQLSRKKGFDLQALSRKFNGLEAVKVSRPGRWGNPFVVSERIASGKHIGADYIAVPNVNEAVACFRELMNQSEERRVAAAEELRGKNLVCWCKPGEPCHADVLLEIANGDLRS